MFAVKRNRNNEFINEIYMERGTIRLRSDVDTSRQSFNKTFFYIRIAPV